MLATAVTIMAHGISCQDFTGHRRLRALPRAFATTAARSAKSNAAPIATGIIGRNLCQASAILTRSFSSSASPPGAHGANRTGRMFTTGDSSGDYLYRALYETGYASQPESRSINDGLTLTGAYIGASGRCAPPDNKPTREELSRCRPFLERELDALQNVRVVVALGSIAFQTYLSILRDRGFIKSLSEFKFGHAAEYRPTPNGPILIASYHPSQQNTSTGKLTREMLRAVFERASKLH